MAQVKKSIPYQIVHGIRFPLKFKLNCIGFAIQYKPTSDDVIIATYPKCGTTWMQMVAMQIFRKGQPLDRTTGFNDTSPFLEMIGEEGLLRMRRPGPIKTHLPFEYMPYSPQAKYVFVIRNPLDTCVSFYYHNRLHPGTDYWDGTFDDFFELFMAGEVEFNDYFDHLLSWYPHRNDENVYWTTYETMKKDLKSVVLELAKFIGQDYYEAIYQDNSVMESILHHCSFGFMKELFEEIDAARRKNGDKHGGHLEGSQNVPKSVPKREQIRRGIVGGWKDHFSEDQYLRMKKKFEEKTVDTDIPDLWPGLFSE